MFGIDIIHLPVFLVELVDGCDQLVDGGLGLRLLLGGNVVAHAFGPNVTVTCVECTCCRAG
jgi:hypothetical protein